MATSVYVFGSGDCGQLGMGEDADMKKKPALHPFFEDKHICAVAAGGLHTLALSSAGLVYSWGCNDEKALGHAGREFEVGLVEGLAGIPVMQVTAGDSISAALSRDGRVYSWGTFRDSKGVLGYNAQGTLIQERPTLLDALSSVRVVQISAGANHLTALTEDGQAFTWGCGEQGQLGRRVLERHKMLGLRPTNVTPRTGRSKVPVRKIVCGSYHTLVIGQDGSIWAMGLNNYGQLGTGDYEERITAELLDPSVWQGHPPCDASAGEHHSLVLTSTGGIFAFGRADSGQLGQPNISDRALNGPIPIVSLANVVQISTGGNHNLALTANNEVYSWGYGGMHQLGHGPDSDEMVPRRVQLQSLGKGSRIIQIAAGGQHSVILVARY